MYDIFFGAKGAPRVATSALAKIKVGRTKRPTFILEQATRVELAGSSLGSCRHTARRRLLFLLRSILYPFLYRLSTNFPNSNKKTKRFAWLFLTISFVSTIFAFTVKINYATLYFKPVHCFRFRRVR